MNTLKLIVGDNESGQPTQVGKHVRRKHRDLVVAQVSEKVQNYLLVSQFAQLFYNLISSFVVTKRDLLCDKRKDGYSNKVVNLFTYSRDRDLRCFSRSVSIDLMSLTSR